MVCTLSHIYVFRLDTAFGGKRSLDELEEEPLPRIC
jgi:hypothetical protein